MSSASDSHSGANRRFSGSGTDPATEFRTWKRWAKAKVRAEVSKGTPREAMGPMLFTLLEGNAADALDHIDIDDLAVENV